MTVTITQAFHSQFGDKADAKLKSAVATAKRAVKARQARLPHQTFTLVGGPFNNEATSLSGPSTGVLTIGDVRGRYADFAHLSNKNLDDALKYLRAKYGRSYVVPSTARPLFWEPC